jgi:hypothetical protein
MSGLNNYLVLAMIATGCVAWEVFRQWIIWSPREREGWRRVRPSKLHYIQLSVAFATVMLSLFAYSVAGLPSQPREYWGQIGLVCTLCALSTWTFAKLRDLGAKKIEWREGEMRFLSSGGAVRHYRFDQIIGISRLFNWKIRFTDGRSLRLDPSAVGSDQLVRDIEQFFEGSGPAY